MSLTHAIRALQDGGFVLIHDSVDRENEVDMVMAAEAVEPSHIATMRRDAGGMICVALHPRIASNLGIPHVVRIYEAAREAYPVLGLVMPNDLPYDERSAFSLWVNHRRTFTGITDVDRALTIRELGRLGAMAYDGPMMEDFGRNFRSPGHVPILRAADGLLSERRGHTELAVALAEMAGITPVVAICEMLDAETNLALSLEDAMGYARMRGLPPLRGEEIVRAYLEKVGG